MPTSTVKTHAQPKPTLLLSILCWQFADHCHLDYFVKPLVASCAICFLYGAYMVLFIISIWILIRRRRKGFHIQCLLIATLFGLATASLALNITLALLEDYVNLLNVNNGFSFGFPAWPGPYDVKFDITWPTFLDNGLSTYEEMKFWGHHLSGIKGTLQIITVASNVVNDIILLWRCYLIWGSHISWVIILPSLLCLTNNVIGILTMAAYRPHYLDFYSNLGRLSWSGRAQALDDHDVFILYFIFGSCCANILLTGLIAGRILHISHQFARLSTQQIPDLYKTFVHASLESGMLYPVDLILYASFLLRMQLKLSWEYSPDTGIVWGALSRLFYTMLVPIMGIASTLIIVRSGLGIMIQDEVPFRATMMGEDWPVTPGQTASRQIRSVSDIQSIDYFNGSNEDC
ncbi:hypothetical protein PM082_012482 [Marasmius tenuissimus]|nr:hypothetical protein PM082_012482 [Marasmius tenuissimus]